MNARIIPTGIHGALDYLASGVNLIFPRLLGLHDAPGAALAPRIDGLAGAGYSLITDYELGAVKLLPMPAHLAFDAAKGVFLAASPWLFGFARNGTRYWLPHVLMGTADVLAAIATKTEREGSAVPPRAYRWCSRWGLPSPPTAPFLSRGTA